MFAVFFFFVVVVVVIILSRSKFLWVSSMIGGSNSCRNSFNHSFIKSSTV